jgi:hypothetical protein
MKCKVWLHSSRVVYFKTNFLIGIILHYFKLCTNSDTLLNRERERERNTGNGKITKKQLEDCVCDSDELLGMSKSMLLN